MDRLKSAVLNLALVLVALGGSMLLLEIAVRLFVPQQLVRATPDLYVPADSLGYAFRPMLHTTVNTGERPALLVTDTAGLRIAPHGRTDASRRVLLIGDSFLAALQVNYEESFAGLLETMRGTNDRTAIWNAGVPGWGPEQYRIAARRRLSDGSFTALVVAFFVGNDVVMTNRATIPALQPTPPTSFAMPSPVTWTGIVAGLLRPLNDRLERRSHLYVLVKGRMQTVLMMLGLTAEYFPAEYLRSESASTRWENTRRLLDDIVAASARRNVPVVFLLLPSDFQVDSAAFAQFVRAFRVDPATVDLDQPNRIMTELLTERGYTVVDVLPALRGAHARGVRTNGRVDRHLTPDGHRIVAAVLDSALAVLPAGKE